MNWKTLGERIRDGAACSRDEARATLRAGDRELLDVLQAAFFVRERHFGSTVTLHVLRNAKSGACPEDCAYCSQSACADTGVTEYPLQTPEELVEGARRAKELGAYRYCIVTSGRGPADAELDRLCEAVRRIKSSVEIEVCTSLGLLTDTQARRLADAGVDRYNHNLETSERFYGTICRTHTYADRVNTVQTARRAGLEICCGGLIGLGETEDDRLDLAFALRETRADSIPVNFLDPRAGTPLAARERLTPTACLRVLAMMRFVNPATEIRVAGGREACLRSLQPLALYPANSIFTEGYLTTGGQGQSRDLDMIRDAGFEVGPWVSAD